MQIIYAKEALPLTAPKQGLSVFLAGPTPRSDTVLPSWRPEMISLLRSVPEVGLILVPEDRDGHFRGDYDNQVDWEEAAIEYCDILLFWVPRNIEGGMPGFTTNVEFGWWLDKKPKLVLGYPPEAQKCRYLEYKFKKHLPGRSIAHTMQDAVLQVGEFCRGEK